MEIFSGRIGQPPIPMNGSESCMGPIGCQIDCLIDSLGKPKFVNKSTAVVAGEENWSW